MIKFFTNKLLNLFNKKKLSNTKTITENKYELPNSNSIVFWVGDDGLPYLKIYVVDTDAKSATNFAELLYSLNSGQYINYTLNVLIDISRQDLTAHEYIKKVLDHWHQFYPQHFNIDNEDEPHIKPTAFNTLINNE